jgi:hypothetical protein
VSVASPVGILGKTEKEKENDDFELWSPVHEKNVKCLFGVHVCRYIDVLVLIFAVEILMGMFHPLRRQNTTEGYQSGIATLEKSLSSLTRLSMRRVLAQYMISNGKAGACGLVNSLERNSISYIGGYLQQL